MAAVARGLFVLAPFLVCALLYLPTLSGGFLSDDYSVVGALDGWAREHRLLAALLSKFFEGLDTPSHYYRPLAMASFGIDYALVGADPRLWRLTNLAVHLASGALVFAIALRLGKLADGRRPIIAPALAAAVFLLFPTDVEAVAWVSGRYDVLALAFMLAAVACFQRSQNWSDRWGIVALLAAVCAFGSKESAALLPAFLLAVAVARRGSDERAGALARAVRDAGPWLIVGIAYFGLRTLIFGSPFRVYPATSPLMALLTGGWLKPLASTGAWLDAALPLAFARPVFVVALAALAAAGAAVCLRRRETRAAWLAMAATALLSVGLLLPHLVALAPNGEQGRLFYTTSAVLALLIALPWNLPPQDARSGAWRVSIAAASLALLACEIALLRAAIAAWSGAGAQSIALVSALPRTASAIPPGGYGLVLVPDHLGNVPFGRNAQGGLVSPPVQEAALSKRLIVQTPPDLPQWPAHIASGLVDALQRYPLAQVLPMVAERRATPGVAPSLFFCWASGAHQIVTLNWPAQLGRRDWLAAWRSALVGSPCDWLADEVPAA